MTCPGSPSFWRGGVGSEVCSFIHPSHTIVGTVNSGRQTDTGPAPSGTPKCGWAAGVWVSPTRWPLCEAIVSFSASWSSTRQNGLGGNRDHSGSGQCLRNTYPVPGAVIPSTHQPVMLLSPFHGGSNRGLDRLTGLTLVTRPAHCPGQLSWWSVRRGKYGDWAVLV